MELWRGKMDLFTKGNGVKEKPVAQENLFFLTALFIRAIFLIILQMEMEYLPQVMVAISKENGKMISLLDTASKHGRIKALMKVIIQMEKSMD